MGHINKPSAEILELPLQVRAEMAMKSAFKKLVQEHIRAGLPLHIWRHGKVVAVPAHELQEESEY
jgi:hypothetical protein